jgi:uncharacterized protein (DUF4213/DUF364 family)
VSIASELISLTADVCQQHLLPPVSWLHLPPENPRDPHHKKFGVLMLADGSCGFFFTRLGDNLIQLRDKIDEKQILSTPVLDLAEGYDNDNLVKRSLGLGALNAIAQHVFSRSVGVLQNDVDPLGQLDLDTSHQVGMVGFFRPLVRMLKDQRVPVTVIEQDEGYLDYEGPVDVTLDVGALKRCDRVLITASTLLNDSLDSVLANCAADARVALIGPTVGCLPDPFFARGIDVVGGSRVANLCGLKKHMLSGENWGNSVIKYCIAKKQYAGAHRLF